MVENADVKDLADDMRMAVGSERHVYWMEESPDLLLKVMRSKHLAGVINNDEGWRNWRRLRKAYAVFRREQAAWSNAMLRASIRGALPPLAPVQGLILTSHGLGQVVARVRGPDGETAPTLENILTAGTLSETHFAALNAFVKEFYDWHIVAYDMRARNIVWDYTSNRFLLVDGFGERSPIPLKSWFRPLNNRRLDRAFQRLSRDIDFVFDPAARQFKL